MSCQISPDVLQADLVNILYQTRMEPDLVGSVDLINFAHSGMAFIEEDDVHKF